MSLSDGRTISGDAQRPTSAPDLTIGADRTITGGGGAAYSAQPQAEAGQRVGREARYELVSKLGEGGMGSVWKARDVQLGREVAIKRMLGSASRVMRERFQRETQAMVGLKHPNVVTLYDAGEDADGLYIVMEYVAGKTLAAHLVGGAMAAAQASEVLTGVCRGASHAHKKGVVHRDIKPGNIMIDEDGTPRLLDFGLVRMEEASELSMAGVGMGTLDYAAPEQKRDASKADARSDVYALGLVIYETLTGMRPPVSLKRAPAAWRTLIEKATDPVPEERHATAEQLLADVVAVASQPAAVPTLSAVGEGEDDLRCPKCKLINTLEAKFCRACSTSLRAECPACSKPVRVGLKRCDQCAADVVVVARLREGLATVSADIYQGQLDEAGACLTALAPLATSGQLGGAGQLQDEWRGCQSAHAAAVADRAKRLANVDADLLALQRGLAAGDRMALPRLRALQGLLGDDPRLAPLLSTGAGVAARWLASSLPDLPERLQRLEPVAVAELRALEGWFGDDARLAPVRAAETAGQAVRAQRTARLQREGLVPLPGAAIDAATGFPQQIVHERTGAVLVLIPAGDFMMGSPASEAGRRRDEAQHPRAIRTPYYLGKTAVTQAQWRKVMGSNPSQFLGDDLPVEQVSWDDCQQFLQKAGGGLRLPSEAEWEYSCRAGTTTPFSFGMTITPEQVQHDGNLPYGVASEGRYRERPVPVGSLPPNAWGLHEMHGNVWEWCQDGYEAYPSSGTEEPSRAAGARVLRGGSWYGSANYCRAAYRRGPVPGTRDDSVGLRLARTLPE